MAVVGTGRVRFLRTLRRRWHIWRWQYQTATALLRALNLGKTVFVVVIDGTRLTVQPAGLSARYDKRVAQLTLFREGTGLYVSQAMDTAAIVNEAEALLRGDEPA